MVKWFLELWARLTGYRSYSHLQKERAATLDNLESLRKLRRTARINGSVPEEDWNEYNEVRRFWRERHGVLIDQQFLK